uniref:helix-turn-helix domain-containing protein n=1 Tax=Lapillicoccus sp. TaxID=1909287 RepID=UPI0039837D4B
PRRAACGVSLAPAAPGGDNRAMTVSGPVVIRLSVVEGAVLRVRVRARAGRGEHRDVVRAPVVLAAAAGGANAVMLARLGLRVDTVGTWRRRFAAEGLPGLTDRPRSGRPRRLARFRSPR